MYTYNDVDVPILQQPMLMENFPFDFFLLLARRNIITPESKGQERNALRKDEWKIAIPRTPSSFSECV